MNKKEIEDYLEKNLKSDEYDIYDNNQRLVWMSDVINVVDKLINGDDKKNKTYQPGYYIFKEIAE